MQTVNRQQAVSLIADMASRYIQVHGSAPRTIIVVGGTAMAMRGLRDESNDVDIFYPDDAFAPIAEDIEKRSGFRIDVTSKTNLWGSLRIHDIEQDAEVLESLEIEGFTIDIAAISPETLFVIKASSMRNKDRDDLPLLVPVVTPQGILYRTSVLLQHTESRSMQEDVLSNILSEMQLAYMDVAKPEWFSQAPALTRKYGPIIADQFGVNLISTDVPPPEMGT